MALPVVVKVAYFFKYATWPVVNTFWEYRYINRDGTRVSFFKRPFRSLGDRRFWIKAYTNTFEVVSMLVKLWRLMRNWIFGKIGNAFVVWHNPTHEHLVYSEVEFEPWGVVRKRCWSWLGEVFSLWRPSKTPLSTKFESLNRVGWHRIKFDGGVIDVRVKHKHWTSRRLRFQRPSSGYKLELKSASRDAVNITINGPNPKNCGHWALRFNRTTNKVYCKRA